MNASSAGRRAFALEPADVLEADRRFKPLLAVDLDQERVNVLRAFAVGPPEFDVRQVDVDRLLASFEGSIERLIGTRI